MAKKLGFIVFLWTCLLIIEVAQVQVESLSPDVSPERETPADSPLPPASSPAADSLPPPEADSLPPPPASSPEVEPLPDSPPPPPPPSHPQLESPSPSPSSSSSQSPAPAPYAAPSDTDPDDEPETEYFPSPTPSPTQEVRKPDDMKASKDEDEFEKVRDEYNGMSGLKKAGIALGAILGVGAIVLGALVYKKRRDNLIRARYTYFSQGEFL